MARKKLAVLARLLVPLNASSAAACFNIGRYGGPKIPFLAATARATAARAALRTLSTWQGWCTQLESASHEEEPIVRALAGNHWPAC